jgi:hypothetical protein
LRPAQYLVGNILWLIGLECSRHGYKSLIKSAEQWNFVGWLMQSTLIVWSRFGESTKGGGEVADTEL